MKKRILAMAVVMGTALSSWAQLTMDVNTKKLGAPIQSTMYGIFFEDINYAADGGLYGELVKNRSFEFPQHLMGWQSFGCVEVKNDGPFERCPHYVVLSDPGHNDRRSGLVNEGYFGIGVKKGEQYRFSVWAKAPKGTAAIRVQLIDENSMDEHQEFVEKKLDITSTAWKKYTITLTSTKTMKHAKLRIFLQGTNSVALEHISLFPVNTYKNRENGMRRDLAQALEDLHPGIFRFPGGCIVEGSSLDERYPGSTPSTSATSPTTTSRTDWAFLSSSNSLRTSVPSPCPSSRADCLVSSRTLTPRSLAYMWHSTTSAPTSRMPSTSWSLPMATSPQSGVGCVPTWATPNPST